MPFDENGAVRISYEVAGSGPPLLLIPGGGLNSTLCYFAGTAPVNAIEEFKGAYLRPAHAGLFEGPVTPGTPLQSGWRPYGVAGIPRSGFQPGLGLGISAARKPT